jgi:hypothetical protein
MMCHKPLSVVISQRSLSQRCCSQPCLHALPPSQPRLHRPSPQVHEVGHNWVSVPRFVRALFTTALTSALSMVPGW